MAHPTAWRHRRRVVLRAVCRVPPVAVRGVSGRAVCRIPLDSIRASWARCPSRPARVPRLASFRVEVRTRAGVARSIPVVPSPTRCRRPQRPSPRDRRAPTARTRGVSPRRLNAQARGFAGQAAARCASWWIPAEGPQEEQDGRNGSRECDTQADRGNGGRRAGIGHQRRACSVAKPVRTVRVGAALLRQRQQPEADSDAQAHGSDALAT